MKLLLIDGNSIINRAFYGIKLLSTKDGRFTNGIYGFMNILIKLRDELNPEAVAIAFDLKAPTFRHTMYDGYKAQRKGMPNELAEQMPVLKELLTALGYRIIEQEGFEADDIIGTLSAKCVKDDKCYIATGDRDSLQLVNPNVTVLLASTKMGKPQTVNYTEDTIKEEYGVTPKQLIEIKALMGDSSDNIPGVAGIGQKTASELIQKFFDIAYIYDNIDSLDIKQSVKDKLIADKDKAFMSRELGTVCLDAPVECCLDKYIPAPADNEKAVKILSSLEMFGMIEKLGLSLSNVNIQQGNEQTASYNLIEDYDFDKLLNALKNEKKAYFTAKYHNGEINELYFALNADIIHISNTKLEFTGFVKSLLTDDSIEKYTYNSKQLFTYGIRNNIDINNIVMDIMLAGYILNPSASGYESLRLAQEYNIPIPLVEGDDEAARDTALLHTISSKFDGIIKENNQEYLLCEMEIPLAKVLASMEIIGFDVDEQGITQFGNQLSERITQIEKEIYEQVGYEFNLNSPKQLGVALFEKLGLPTRKKTKSGYSTNAEVLESLADQHPVVASILEYRTLVKLKSTYCDGLLKVISKEDGRIHSNFNQTETRTGRISSTEPNLQNIPVRQDLGRELRKYFKAQDGYMLIDADYSQIELRVLADIADDKTMIEAFNNNDDIHAITASQVFNIPLSMVTPLMRSRAKAVNFGIVYGIGAFSLSKDIGVTRKEADTYIKEYLEHYSGVKQYMDNVVKEAKDNGFAETKFNRRRYLPELSASNAIMRNFGERVARNMPIQGTAADIIKIAMIKVYDRLKEEGLKARLILQVHDELIVEAPESEVVKASKILKEEMENALKMKVPLTVDVHSGKTWYSAKG